MEQFDLFGLAAWAEIAGVFGIVVSLIYVGREIRHNTHVAQGSTDDRIGDALRPIYIRIMADPELARIIRGGRDNPKEMSEDDSFRYQYFLRTHLDIWEGVRARGRQGLISESNAQSWESFFEVWARDYLTEHHWVEVQQEYEDYLVHRVNAVLCATQR